jgi:hypothetical protein
VRLAGLYGLPTSRASQNKRAARRRPSSEILIAAEAYALSTGTGKPASWQMFSPERRGQGGQPQPLQPWQWRP